MLYRNVLWNISASVTVLHYHGRCSVSCDVRVSKDDDKEKDEDDEQPSGKRRRQAQSED